MVTLNQGAVGNQPGQCSADDAARIVVHELTEREVITSFAGAERVESIAADVRLRATQAYNLSDGERSRFDPKHLTAIGAEYVAAHETALGNQHQRLCAVGAAHKRLDKHMRSDTGGKHTADSKARQMMFTQIVRQVLKDKD
jgi:hypothetical protein